VASAPGVAIAVRDFKDPDSPRPAFATDDRRAFLRQVKARPLA
jgi:hypothetical protein